MARVDFVRIVRVWLWEFSIVKRLDEQRFKGPLQYGTCCCAVVLWLGKKSESEKSKYQALRSVTAASVVLLLRGSEKKGEKWKWKCKWIGKMKRESGKGKWKVKVKRLDEQRLKGLLHYGTYCCAVALWLGNKNKKWKGKNVIGADSKACHNTTATDCCCFIDSSE